MPPLLRSLVLLALVPLVACGSSRHTGSPVSGYTGDALGEAAVVQGARARVRPPGAEADRQLVREATLALEVGSDAAVAGALAEAKALTEALGGYVSWEGPGAAVLRVPDARLDHALDRLQALGEVERREVQTRDVTAAYTDLELRLATARALQARLRALLADAATVADVLAVERELARVTVEVEQMEGQLRQLQNQVAFSTVRLSVSDAVSPGPLGWVLVGAYRAVKWLFVWD